MGTERLWKERPPNVPGTSLQWDDLLSFARRPELRIISSGSPIRPSVHPFIHLCMPQIFTGHRSFSGCAWWWGENDGQTMFPVPTEIASSLPQPGCSKREDREVEEASPPPRRRAVKETSQNTTYVLGFGVCAVWGQTEEGKVFPEEGLA